MGTFNGAVHPHCDAPIVAFDFDGTITVRDSFVGFLRWRAGPVRFLAGVARMAPAGVAFAIDRDRGRIKAAAVRRFLGGMTVGEVGAEAEAFAAAEGPGLLRPDALRCWRRWKDLGARMVIVSASPGVIVDPFARELGAERTICTRLVTDAGGRITGALDGANCRAAEKVVRLKAAFGPAVRLAAAYGDSAGDREMLAIAEEPGYRVFTERP